jgi:hypothetical protein
MGNIKVSIRKAGTSDIEEQIRQYKKKVEYRYGVGVLRALVSSLVAEALLMEVNSILETMQSEYFSGGGSVTQEDLTQFAAVKEMEQDAIKAEIQKNLVQAAASYNLATGDFEFELFSNDFIGRGKEDDKTGSAPIQWLVYFIDGNLEDDLIWVNQDTYKAIFGSKGSSASLGRFGTGILLKVHDKEAMNGKLSRVGESVDSLKHPQSGKPGQDWFNTYEVMKRAKVMDIIHQSALRYAETASQAV